MVSNQKLKAIKLFRIDSAFHWKAKIAEGLIHINIIWKDSDTVCQAHNMRLYLEWKDVQRLTRFRQNSTPHELIFQKLKRMFFGNLPIMFRCDLYTQSCTIRIENIWTLGRNDTLDFSYRSPKSNLRSNQIMRHVKSKLWLCWFSKHHISYNSNSSIQHRTNTKAAVRIDCKLIEF